VFSRKSQAAQSIWIITDVSRVFRPSENQGEAITAIAVEPAGKAAFVHSCMQTRLISQYNKITH